MTRRLETAPRRRADGPNNSKGWAEITDGQNLTVQIRKCRLGVVLRAEEIECPGLPIDSNGSLGDRLVLLTFPTWLPDGGLKTTGHRHEIFDWFGTATDNSATAWISTRLAQVGLCRGFVRGSRVAANGHRLSGDRWLAD